MDFLQGVCVCDRLENDGHSEKKIKQSIVLFKKKNLFFSNESSINPEHINDFDILYIYIL